MAKAENFSPSGGYPLISLFGFTVKLDLSWLLLGLLITWTLAAGVFPQAFPDLAPATYWWMGVAVAVGILVSIVCHELSHALVARHYGLAIGGITLFIFGGVAEMREEPASPRVEFLVALAGPVASLLLALVFWQAGQLTMGTLPTAVSGVLGYLAFINVVLAAFNLVPAFPLDGGRMLRAALWAWRKNLTSATRISSRLGAWFGILLMVLGAVAFISGNFIGGMWYLLIGAFLRGAAHASYRHLLARQFLRGKTVRDFMDAKPATVPPDISLQTFVDDYVYAHHHRLFPVIGDTGLIGCVDVESIKAVPRGDWATRSVRDVMTECSPQNTVSPDADGTELLRAMMRPGGRTQQIVTDPDGRLAGVVSLEDLRELMALKLELASGQDGP